MFRRLMLAIGLLSPLPAAAQNEPAVWRVSRNPALTIGSRDAVGPELFGAITGAIRLSNGIIVISDGKSMELRFFSSNGKHLTTTGRRGSGPGEFRIIAPIQRCAGDSVFAYDPAQQRVSVFTPEGKYSRSLEVRRWSPDGLPPYDFWCHPAGVIAFIHRSSEPPKGEGPLRPNVPVSVVVNGDSAIRLGPIPATERYFRNGSVFPRHLGKETIVVPGPRTIYVGTGDTYEIGRYSIRGEPLGSIRESRLPRPVTEAEVSRYIKDFIANAPASVETAGYERWFRELDFPRTYPAYRKLLVDDSDNLWVEEYPVPGTRTHHWAIFNPAGSRIARIDLPTGFRLLQAGRDYVLGVWRDDYDTDFLRIYSIVK
jgi:hypothetical protein